MADGHSNDDDAGSFDADRFEALRRARGTKLGTPLTSSARTASTNDDALQAARAGAPHGATFVADVQTHGRGRRGHTWTSPPGENLLVSIVLRPDLPAERVSAVTLAIGLAVRDASATRVDAPLLVKWPNDVVARTPNGLRKLAGVLVESHLRGTEVSALVVGIGLNVSMRSLPEPIRDIATSLALLGDPDAAREPVLADLLAKIEAHTEAYVRGGLAPILDDLHGHDALVGSEVEVDGTRGTAAGIDPSGALLVRTSAGIEHVQAGQVRVLSSRER